MADSPTSPATSQQPNPNPSESVVNPNPAPDPQPSVTSITPPPPLQQSPTLQQPPNPNPNLNLNFASPLVPGGYAPPPGAVLPLPPSFRPLPLFNPVPGPNYQTGGQTQGGMQPPGVGGAGAMMLPYQVNPGLRQFAPMPNGYPPQGTMLPLGMPRYPAPYPAMVRPAFPLRPPGAIGVLPAVLRPLIPGIPGVRPLAPPVFIRPPSIPAVTPAEKPLTTIYVSKIPITADNEFMLSLFKFCGPVRSWKRPQDLRNGTPKGFGFCEFESAEGVLRALRLLSKFSLDGQELALIVDQATTEYLERYVEKKTENSKKLKENQVGVSEKENEGAEKKEPSKEDSKKDDPEKKETRDMANFGIVTDEDKEADGEALEKLKSTTEEWLKTRPPPPPPPPPSLPSAADGSGNSNTDLPAKSREVDSDVDLVKSDTGEEKIGDETTSDNKTAVEHDRPESSPDRRRYDRRDRDRDREKREKERDIVRYEREAERERVRKEREQRRKIEDAERKYEECLKEWEYREKERERQRNHLKDREKERERKRKREVLYDEEEDDDDSRRRSRRSVLEEKRKRWQREKEDDMADRLIEEEEEIAEAKRRAEEAAVQQQQQEIDSLKHLPGDVTNGGEKTAWADQSTTEINNKPDNQDYQGDSDHENDMMDDEVLQNGTHDEPAMASVTVSDTEQSGSALPRKLGFGLLGPGKRSNVLSVFNEEDDDVEGKETKMRPLVPIDYSTEEIQAVQLQPIVSGATPPNLAAAAEFAKRISHASSKEEKADTERERSRHSHDRSSSQRDKGRNEEYRTKDENKGKHPDRHKDRDHGIDKVKTPDNKKLLDAKQLIDMIPKTKEELFSYEINWAVYDKHELHERMRPWISKKITDFLGEEEISLIDYIVSSTREHMKASEMLEQLQSILDEEAEMFILKMWRMLIFEIKKVETGLSLRSSKS